MKTKNINDIVPYIYLSVVGVVLIGMIVYYIVNASNSVTDVANQVITSTEDLSANMKEHGIKVYDGEEVRGSDVTNFIKKHLGDYNVGETAPISVEVTTKAAGTTYTNTYTNKKHISDIKNFSDIRRYIKPTAIFQGEVLYSTNKVILGIRWTQK